MNERIGYPEFILDQEELDKIYDGVSGEFPHYYVIPTCLPRLFKRYEMPPLIYVFCIPYSWNFELITTLTISSLWSSMILTGT